MREQTFAALCTKISYAGQSGLLPKQRMRVQKLLALAASGLWQCSEFAESGRSFASELVDYRPTFRCGVPQQSRRGTLHRDETQRFGWRIEPVATDAECGA